jgi:hypothetical protein
MAAPMLSGAAALLLERRPELTAAELRGLLIAGASELPRPPDIASRAGAGALDVAASVRAADALPRSSSERPSSEHSRLRMASDRAVSDASRSLSALVWLKDTSGEPFDAEIERVSVALRGGELRSPVARIAPGAYEFALAAAPPSPEVMSIEVLVDAEPLLALELPIEGGVGPRPGDAGGCGLVAPGAAFRGSAALTGLALALGLRAARRLRARSGRG